VIGRESALGLWWGLLGLTAALQIPILFQQFHGQAVLFAFLLLVFGGLALVKPVAAIPAVLLWLAVLGDFRRYVGSVIGFAGNDPLLLIGPAAAALLLVGPLTGNRIGPDTPLSKCILVLMVWMTVQMFNPVQGGVAVGLAGALFYFVPLLWYWIGKTYATCALVEFIAFRVVLPVAVGASLLGLYQAFFGLLPFEQAWVEASGYAALWVGSRVRPISFFTSASEYGNYLALAIVLTWAGWLQGRCASMLFLPVLAVALFLAGMRGPIVFTLFTLAALWAAQGRSRTVWLPRLGLALAIGVAGLIFALGQIDHSEFGERTQDLVAHQAQGLLNPLDPEHSTLGLHMADIGKGLFIDAMEHPIGMGLGATTLAAAKFDGAGHGSNEADFSNMMVSLGLPGGIMYGIIIITVLLTAIRYWVQARSLAGLLILGALVVTFRGWLNGGEYSVAALIWFLIGALDRLATNARYRAAGVTCGDSIRPACALKRSELVHQGHASCSRYGSPSSRIM
jgi:hypothetical protein